MDAVLRDAVLLDLLHQHLGRHPGIQFPATSRIAIPLVPGAHQLGAVHRASASSARAWGTSCTTINPPGVPLALKFLVVPIEFFSKFLCARFSLAVRLFANMTAGHVLLTIFAIMTNELLIVHNSGVYQVVFAPLPFARPRRVHCLRAPRRRAAGLHLHDPHGGLHRRVHASRALAHPVTDLATSTRYTGESTQCGPSSISSHKPPPIGPDLKSGLGSGRLRPRGHRPGHRHRLPRRQLRAGHGAPARDARASSARRCSSASRSPKPWHSSGSSSSSSSTRGTGRESSSRGSDMRMRKLLAVGLLAVAASIVVSGTASAEDPGKNSARSSSSASRPRSTTTRPTSRRRTTRNSRTPSRTARSRRASSPRLLRDHLGRPRVPDRARAPDQVRVPGAQEGCEGARGQDPQRPRRRRARRVRRPRTSARSTRRSSVTHAPRRTASSRRRARPPTASAPRP